MSDTGGSGASPGDGQSPGSGRRIHIFGASGSGTTTLGRALAQHLAIPHFDTDDFYWAADADPYVIKRPISERLRLIEEVFLPRPDWVLSGALESWGGPIIHRFTLAVRLTVPTKERIARLKEREARRGPMTPEKQAFIDWAAGYDSGTESGRSLQRHLVFADTLGCPVLTLSGETALTDLVEEVSAVLPQA